MLGGRRLLHLHRRHHADRRADARISRPGHQALRSRPRRNGHLRSAEAVGICTGDWKLRRYRIATATGSHLVPRVGFKWIPERLGPAMDRFADLLTGLFLLGVTWYGFTFVLSSRATDLRAPVLDWSVWPFQLAIPLGFLSAAVRYFFYAASPALKPVPPEFQE